MAADRRSQLQQLTIRSGSICSQSQEGIFLAAAASSSAARATCAAISSGRLDMVGGSACSGDECVPLQSVNAVLRGVWVGATASGSGERRRQKIPVTKLPARVLVACLRLWRRLHPTPTTASECWAGFALRLTSQIDSKVEACVKWCMQVTGVAMIAP